MTPNGPGIIQGMPPDAGVEAIAEESQKGKVELGGCVVEENDPDWHCKECTLEF